MTSLPQLMEAHDLLAANQSSVLYAVLRTLRMVADGKEFNEGDFRDWIAAGEKLRTSTLTVEQQMVRLPVQPLPPLRGAQRVVDVVNGYLANVPTTAPLTTGDDDRPFIPDSELRSLDGLPTVHKWATTKHDPEVRETVIPIPPFNPTSPQPTLASLTNIHSKVVDGRTKEGRELRAANTARRNQA